MPTPIVPLAATPLPNDEVHFRVEVDQRDCTPTNAAIRAALSDLQANGITLKISSIVTHAAHHFINSTIDPFGVGEMRVRASLCWLILSAWNPRAEIPRGGPPYRLVLDNPKLARLKGLVTELLGTGVGLLVAKRVYGIRLSLWKSTGMGQVDFMAPNLSPGALKLEVRGRFDRVGWPAAHQGIRDKLRSWRDYRHAMGVLFAPRSTPNRRATDILVCDPEGPGSNPDKYFGYRFLLQHYLRVFSIQGFREVANSLMGLIRGGDQTWDAYLKGGVNVRRGGLSKRVSFRIGQRRFNGTIFDGAHWPAHLFGKTEIPKAGVFFWGLDSQIHDSIISGSLDKISELAFEDECSTQGPYIRSVLSDGMAMVWAPTVQEIIEHP